MQIGAYNASASWHPELVQHMPSRYLASAGIPVNYCQHIITIMQAEEAKEANGLMQEDREEQLGIWRGTISADRSYSSSPSPSYATQPVRRTYGSAPRGYARPLTPPVRPPQPLARPTSSASEPQPPVGQGM